MGEDSKYGLVVSFTGLPFGDSPEHAFVHGVEFGQLWQRMRSGAEAEIEGTFHASNREVIERACAAEGWASVCSMATDESGKKYDEWIFVKMSKTAKAKPNPHGLRVV